jgi:hypothetical protein
LYEKLSASRFSRALYFHALDYAFYLVRTTQHAASLFSSLPVYFSPPPPPPPPSSSPPAAEAPVFPLLPRPRSTISRVPTKFSRAAIPDRLYNYPVLSSSGGADWLL